MSRAMCKTMAGVFLLALLGLPANAIQIDATGDWDSLVIDGALLTAGEWEAEWLSGADEVKLAITSLPDPVADTYEVDIRRTDTTWHADLQLEVQVTDYGGPGTIIAGGGWTAILTGDQAFFDGVGECADIDLQFRLTVPVTTPVDGYSTTITFTAVET